MFFTGMAAADVDADALASLSQRVASGRFNRPSLDLLQDTSILDLSLI